VTQDRREETAVDELAAAFEGHRSHLLAVAHRLLGGTAEAEDVVQESWLRLRSQAEDRPADVIENLGGWLTTVVTRLSLDQLRRRSVRGEVPLEVRPEESAPAPGPEGEADLAEQVGDALLVVLDTLSPAERVCFVLHDLFGVSFDEIARMLGRTQPAVRQLASRGRRRVRAPAEVPDADRQTQQRVVESFLTASRAGDFRALLDLLDPGAVIRADQDAVRLGSASVVTGAHAVAETFCGRAQGARIAELDGYAAATWSVGGTPRVVFGFVLDGARIAVVEMIADPEVIAALDLGSGSSGPTGR
jgi:RNA polymerase sigma factor (sigma-70 family)